MRAIAQSIIVERVASSEKNNYSVTNLWINCNSSFYLYQVNCWKVEKCNLLLIASISYLKGVFKILSIGSDWVAAHVAAIYWNCLEGRHLTSGICAPCFAFSYDTHTVLSSHVYAENFTPFQLDIHSRFALRSTSIWVVICSCPPWWMFPFGTS